MSDFGVGHIIFLIAFVYFIVRPILSGYQKGRQTEETVARVDEKPPKVWSKSSEFHWPALGAFDFEVVGESNYQKTIKELAGIHDDQGANTVCIAELALEDLNEHDPKAVVVKIAGKTVGYMSRDDARSFRRRLAQKGLSSRTTTCEAQIVGGWASRNGDQIYYGVKLDLKPFE